MATFQVQPNLEPNLRVQTGRVGPQDPKTGPIGLGLSPKGSKFGLNPIMYLINPISIQSGWTIRVQNWVESGRVGPQCQNSSQIQVGFVGFA